MSGLTRKKKIAITSISVSLVLILTATLLVLYFTIGHSFNKNTNPSIDVAAFNKDKILTSSEVQQDKAELINNLENYHPYFVIQEMPDYQAAKDKFLNATIATVEDFYFATAEFLTVFKDCHTWAIPTVFSDRLSLGLTGYFDGDKIFFYPDGSENEAAEFYAINSHSASLLIDETKKYFPAENNNSFFYYVNYMFYKPFLSRAGIEIGSSVIITFIDKDGVLFEREYSSNNSEISNQNSNTTVARNFTAENKDGILTVKIRQFNNDGSFSDCISSIKNAVSSGVKKVIIDVRSNPGGSDNYAREILDALGFEYSTMGFTIRYSDATAKYRGTWRKSGYKTVQEFKYKSKNKNNIDLKVFCDELTGSASMTIVNQCKYSDLGEVVGRSPGQNSNFCGNAVTLQLSNSKVIYSIPLSYSYFEQGGTKVPDAITVDIKVPITEEYFDSVSWK